ncbi:metalloregulator ArsR/SmtB family transcription factor [Saprospira sp. CCB-QB6]|uniref:ArsR/SmtB family transcription factor n=1 Tax=Saprospira sp. CCB-QB6 TaxID=3023936 RepID=UPI002349ABA0|nr:metalloregulator ArsR/SmtB family transcription factor [Saprospira sp. CCB-QB6]WCL82515.1 metalloregulator ArsR/SmtB family transcription factor [Saprospira sp. CCB-QB6]
MASSKTELFTTAQNEMAKLAKALAHPARIAILERLIAAEACITSDLVEELGLAQATVSQHLKALKEAGLIQGNIEGVRRNYCIDSAGWQHLQKTLGPLINGTELLNSDKKCC